MGCRFAVWPAVRAFLEALESGAVVADIGCGNGKYFGVRQDVALLACDRSPALVKAALERVLRPVLGQVSLPATDVFVADGMTLPYRHSSCDAVLCIAVLHHISSPERRRRFLCGLRDILVPGGCALVTVWAEEQENPSKTVAKWMPMDVIREHCNTATESVTPDSGKAGASEGSADFFVPWHLPFHRAEAHLAAARASKASVLEHDPQDLRSTGPAIGELDHKKQTVVFKRYYHLFAEGELHELASSIKGVTVRDCFYDASNWVVVFLRES
jgi:alkylated DNA repair protein alkB homolog 8